MVRFTTFVLALTGTQAVADLSVRFDEGAPKDRFTLTNTGACALPAMRVTLDIGTAPAGLIFDVTGDGAGVEVFQPFDVVTGAEALSRMPQVSDGDTAITLDLNGLAVDRSVAFTIDIDDTGGRSETTVSGSEIAGASLRAVLSDKTLSAAFDNTATAVLKLAVCTS